MAVTAICGLHLNGDRKVKTNERTKSFIRYDPEEFAESHELDTFIKEFNRRT